MSDSKTRIGKGLSSMHRTTSRLLDFEKIRPVGISEFNKQISRLINDPDDSIYRSTVISSYSELHSAYTSLTNEENTIARMERNAHIRNIFFRALTTLIIGFSIMFVYWVASCLGISMPLKGLS